jgi:hypothetical protein
MSRFRVFLISGLVALACLAAVGSSASAQAQTQADGSCNGVLSSFAGSVQGDEFFRQDFAPRPGANVSRVAHQSGDLGFCASLIVFP